MNEEVGQIIEKVEAVLEKFDGEADDPNKVLRERIHIVDDEIVSREFFDEEGNLIKTEGGNNGTNDSIP